MAEAATAEKVAFAPKGKSFTQRVDGFIEDVKATHSIIITKDDGRTAEWQQKYHVAHMFIYNKYESTTPAKVDTGKRTISWAHLSDPKVTWASVQWSDFLKTAAGGTPVVQNGEWAKGSEPDQAKTEAHVKKMLKDDGIGNSGEAMVSSGLSPCGEPCKCKAGKSNHLSDAAADLKSTALEELVLKLAKDKLPDLDAYLKTFGLHRPLVNHPKSPEKWHVESLEDAKL